MTDLIKIFKITTTGILGGKNTYLGILYLIIGGISIAFMVIILYFYKIN